MVAVVIGLVVIFVGTGIIQIIIQALGQTAGIVDVL